jgi:hypothetical protein
VGGAAVGRGVHRARRRDHLLDELAQKRGLHGGLVDDRGQAPVGVGAEAQPLDRGRPVAGEVEHLLATHSDARRPADEPCGERGQDDVRSGRALRAEPAADVVGDDAHLVGLELEHPGDRVARGGRALRGVADRQPAASHMASDACGSIALLCSAGVV